MCGILQVFSRNKPIDRERFHAALAEMKHRGPDHTGSFLHEHGLTCPDGSTVFVASGHQRLSILDLDPRSNQPFRREGRSLIFNGEIYNFRELRQSLAESGSEFRTSGDTEVLLEGLRHHGVDFLHRCNGMWGFSFLNEETRHALVARDRHGKKPVFYYADDEQIIISSTIRPVFAYLGRSPRWRNEGIDSFLAHGVMFPAADERTHFHELRQVRSGHALDIDLNSWELRDASYFEVRDAITDTAPEEAELAPLLKDAVVSRLVSDRKVGLLLSGGIDSTLVLSVIHAAGLHEQVHCYIGETGRSEDASYAKRCVGQLGIEATVVDLGYGADMFERYLKMCLHQEKPFPFLGSSMAMPEMYERIAADDVRVVLDGTGGDEQFGGYWDRQYPVALREALRNGDFTWLRDSLPRSPKPMTRVGRASSTAWHLPDFRALRKSLSPTLRALRFKPSSAMPADPLASPPATFTETLIRDASPGGRLGEWIWHNDRNAMMAGIENRSPILDYRLLPFIGTGYANKFVRQWNKHELRKVFDAFTPLPTQWREQKQGFRWNGRVFLRENRDAILDLIRSSPYLASRFDTKAFTDLARRDKRALVNSITPRLLCIAGISERLGVGESR
jgi:asparagine synthase (glutamine-hydrolysing)